MSGNTKRWLAIGGGVVAVAVGAFFLLGNRDDIPILSALGPPPTCPLSGEEPRREPLLDRPAVAVKVENNPSAYPLSGLAEAEVVYEEQVEGGLTRFVALFHCSDAEKAGPVRSARIVDPAIVSPYTRILGAAGGNDAVREALEQGNVIIIDELSAGTAMERVERPGYTMEHTLYANTAALRRLGRKEHADPPPDDLFEFGELEGKARKARSISIQFSSSQMSYAWQDGRWMRFDAGEPLLDEDGTQVGVDNVLVEEHTVNYSDISDVVGARSPEIEDVTGSGRAILFRDGRVIVGRWKRATEDDPVRFETKDGDRMILSEGTTWIELLPNKKGEVKGSVSWS